MIDQWIEQLKSGNCISEPDLKKLCIHVRFVVYRHISLIYRSYEILLNLIILGKKSSYGRVKCPVCQLSSDCKR
jgi:hypothetical protein